MKRWTGVLFLHVAALLVVVQIVGATRQAVESANGIRSPKPASSSTTDGRPGAASSTAITTTGRFWEPLILPSGVTTYSVRNLTVHPLDAFSLFMATSQGLYKTEDAGQTWELVESVSASWVGDAAYAPSNPNRVYAISWGTLHWSGDGGVTWNQAALPANRCRLEVAPSNAEILYARKCGIDSSPLVYRSADGGQTWTGNVLTSTAAIDSLAIAPADPNVLIYSDFDHSFRSADGGVTWTEINVGTRYFGRPIFDPKPPHTLYLGHWRGLLRSADAGLTWEDSRLDQEFSALMVSPLDPGLLLGGNTEAAWGIHSDGASWQAEPWDAPIRLSAVWRSVSDGRAVYTRSDDGLWRYIQRTETAANAIFLPFVNRNKPSAASFPAAALAALDRTNLYRARIGVIPLRLHASIVRAAQNHANYHMLNHGDGSAWANGPHGEVAGKPGFTGTWPSDRIVVEGYPWFGGSEVMHFLGNPTASVDDWMSTIYHRVIMLDAGAHYTGYGFGKDSRTAVDVMDFGGGPTETGVWLPAQPHPLSYPADGQTGVPTTWGGGESPDPLPPGASRPVGYPFTLQGVGDMMEVTAAELRDTNGQLVPVHPNPPDCHVFNCYALIAVSPLQPNSSYAVHAQGKVGQAVFNQVWRFTTGGGFQPSRPAFDTSVGPAFPGDMSASE